MRQRHADRAGHGPVNPDYQYWCEECARALIIKGDPIETYRELEGEPIYGRLLDEHCTLKRFYQSHAHDAVSQDDAGQIGHGSGSTETDFWTRAMTV